MMLNNHPVIWSWRQPYYSWQPMSLTSMMADQEVTDVTEARAVLARIMAL